MILAESSVPLTLIQEIGHRIAEHIPFINHGGCCVYAAILADRLQEHGIPVWGRVADSWCASVNTARDNAAKNNISLESVSDWNRAGLSFCHVFLQFVLDGEHYSHDTDNIVSGNPKSFANHTVQDGYLSVTELKTLAASVCGWNRVFNRDQIPTIQAMVDEYLPPYSAKIS
jgi:hypothetical protein